MTTSRFSRNIFCKRERNNSAAALPYRDRRISMNEDTIKVYGYRWIVLAAFMFITAMTQVL